MGDLATGLDDSFFGLVNHRVGGRLVLKPDDGRLFLINSGRARKDRKGGSEESKRTHDQDLGRVLGGEVEDNICDGIFGSFKVRDASVGELEVVDFKSFY